MPTETIALLPCGAAVRARGDMTHSDNSPVAVAERITWQRERFAIGSLVFREDGSGPIRITSMDSPANGGGIYAYGDHTKRPSANFACGPLTSCRPA